MSNKIAGRRLRERRVNAGLSPEQLGGRVGLAGMTIRRLEEGIGEPRVRTKFLIAQHLDCQVTDLWPLPRDRAAIS